ncbi:Tex-like N-terminal domain-containing protein [Mycoplasma sp. Ms02]|uniref:helix-hairpin-helix domain-containing protein n=1 Tax=Mycoplasma sp. Ms02 TaxID=353851 RepID=UPI001C895CB7|nr:Tex-like N-terminal domain-containing protein [Mycoplasma sp. Ms02]QZE12378.1 helix-hairpin-helix domain-containing protein [Mycoplasma sp. Ms02]
MNEKVISLLAQKMGISEQNILETKKMLDEGSTVAFISRYRKAQTGNLDEEQVNQIFQEYTYYQEFFARKEAIIKILEERALLTPEILKMLDSAQKKQDLETIYEPFKLGKKTKASDAIALGLEPLAKEIMFSNDPQSNIFKYAQTFINEKVPSVEFALENAIYIVSQWISQDPKVREMIKNDYLKYSKIVTKKKKTEHEEAYKFENYFDYSISTNYIKNHQVLAISRAHNLKIIDLKFEINLDFVKSKLIKKFCDKKKHFKFIKDAIEDSLKRLIIPSIEREIWSELFEKAEVEAIKLFANNIETLLMGSAVKDKYILAIDPAYVNGCKIAYLKPNGDLITTHILYPHSASNAKIQQSTAWFDNFVKTNKIDIIVVGSGTASHETSAFVKNRLKINNIDVKVEIVSEIGASVYSASKIAQEEFPDLTVELRSAINIGRKFQDPLNELVKIDPKSIGVGQYQHDLNQKELTKATYFKVQKVVNLVGVNLNSATKQILTHISGLSEKMAQKIIDHRLENGLFTSRKDLKKVKGLGSKTFEQAIGFLRIFESSEFLDKTSIHPESYKIAKKIMKDYNYDQENNSFGIDLPNLNELANEYESDLFTVKLIIESLQNPQKDIRDKKTGFKIDESLETIDDVVLNQKYWGRIENITDFGLFIFIGIKNSVFVHTSKLVNRTLNELGIGMDVEVEIINIDKDKNRLSGQI